MRPALWLGTGLAVLACSGDRERPQLLEDPKPEVEEDAGPRLDLPQAEAGCPVPEEVAQLCGSEVIPVSTEPLNLYFLLDRSGSMSETLDGSLLTRYQAATQAILEVLRTVGHRTHYGLAIAPDPRAAAATCDPGREVLAVTQGDPACFGKAGERGPVLTSLATSLAGLGPEGATPLGATLQSLVETLPELEGETVLILATDGAPNCNADVACDADACIPNIEGFAFDDEDGPIACDEAFNCCDPQLTVPGAGLNCVDSARTETVLGDLLEAGVRTYVVGLPGSEPYRDVLSGFAEAGGADRAGDTRYYAVSDSEELGEVLLDIGLAVTTDCELPLELVPPDRDLVNVYFDANAVPFDEENGWRWLDDGTISLEGEACDELESGNVFGVEVLAGCPSVVR
jgi:hypothetical protein